MICGDGKKHLNFSNVHKKLPIAINSHKIREIVEMGEEEGKCQCTLHIPI